MEITEVKAFQVQLPVTGRNNYAFVKVSTDEGIIGWGECTVDMDSITQIVEEFGLALEPYRPFWYEEPVQPQNVDAMAQVARSVNIPLATGERLYTKWGFKDLLEKQAVAVVQPDACHTGGILELKKIAAMAETYFIGFAPHNPYGPVNTMAALHLATCTPNFLIQEGGHHEYDVLLTEPFPAQKGGYFDIPKGPGLGVDLNEEALEKYACPRIHRTGSYRRAIFESRQQSYWI